ncbi:MULTISPECIES: response regulator transcription factor [Kitasatospora]|uniref:response regulator transcription factor n=1 Tax=Kitasatospora TaxID=2063 RepID=UPI0004C44ADA|nr:MULTISPECIES: response regulator transcription factor [unclassified Kitasatospora]WAL70120.1 response regulator transcription factor [Kitasatospora sp. YST-16]WNW36160.1 response regulator transcription factor [Streptomyces sp. Li-HN-5-13]
MSTRILVVDDEQLIRAGFRAILQAEPDLEVVGEAADGLEATELARQLRPDVVLMDVRMPRLSGIDATAHLVRSLPDAPRVLVVTTFENDAYVYQALRAGAQGFLLKRSRADALVHAVRLVARGDSLLFPAAVRELALRHAPVAPDRSRIDRLSAREGEVLRLMAAGLANAEIADRMQLGAETVKTHVARLLAKLEVRDRTQAVIAAYESGFVTAGSGPPPF